VKDVKRLIVLLALALTFTLALVPAGTVQAKKPLKCELFIELNWDWEGFPWGTPGSKYTWIGTVWGDINGDFYVTLSEASYPGKTEHFSETWIIENETEGWVIEGFDEGVWKMSNFKWLANGGVTSATGTWSYLVGSNMQYSGTTTEFPVPYGTPVNGTGKMHITMRP